MPVDPENRERNKRVTQDLVDYAARIGLWAVKEHPIPGGRIDVVWFWRSPVDIPGVGMAELPVVGFEIESSWRTRKHIKGDLLNLQDLNASLSVILLLGDGQEVESTRRFADQLVDRPGCRIVVWSEQDLNTLLNGQSELTLPEMTHADNEPSAARSGKYQPLVDSIQNAAGATQALSFAEIERILGSSLPPSARRHRVWWSSGPAARALRNAGWRVDRPNLDSETVTLVTEPEHR